MRVARDKSPRDFVRVAWLLGETKWPIFRAQRRDPRAWKRQAGVHGVLHSEIDAALALVSKYDGIVYEMEHNPYDVRALGDALQYMLNRGQIVERARPRRRSRRIARIPANGVEKNQWFAKQVLDRGVLRRRVAAHQQRRTGVQRGRHRAVTAAEERAALRARAACAATARPTRRATGASRKPSTTSVPTSGRSIPKGEIFVMLMIESVTGIENLDEILAKVPGIGAVLIGEGDL